jgi:hypothetical protein
MCVSTWVHIQRPFCENPTRSGAPALQGALGGGGANAHAHVHLKNPSKKHPPTSFFFSPPTCFFFIAFSGVSQQVEFKNTPKKSRKKVGVENVSQKNEENSISFFSVIFYAFLNVSLYGEFKNTKTIFVEKSPKTSKKAPTHLRGQ